jgi:hypothetical protein
MPIDKPLPDRVLQALGDVLEARGLTYELVVVGGSSLLLLGLLDRPTRDLDALAIVEDGAYVRAEPFPLPLAQAVASVGRAFRLSDDWLNPGPTDLLRFGLPEGFRERTTLRRFGALTLHIAGRFDQVCFKLYAAVDQGPGSKHAADLRALRPSRDELLAAGRWSRTHDPSDGYRQALVELLAAFDVEAADELV